MKYSIALILDDESQNILNEVRKFLNDNGIKCDYSISHITLVMYADLKKHCNFYNKVEEIKKNFKTFDIELNLLDVFVDKVNTIYLKANNKELTQIHNNVLNILKDFNESLDLNYSKDKWIPHCTIAKGLTNNELKSSYELLKKHLKLPLRLKIKKIEII